MSSQASIFQVQLCSGPRIPLNMHMSKRSRFQPEPETITTTTTKSCATLTVQRNAFALTLLCTYIESQVGNTDLREVNDDGVFEKNDEHKPDSEDDPYFVAASQPTINYFTIADALARRCIPNTATPCRLQLLLFTLPASHL